MHLPGLDVNAHASKRGAGKHLRAALMMLVVATFAAGIYAAPKKAATAESAGSTTKVAEADLSGRAIPSRLVAGPTQILAASNGRIKVFDKAGVLGALNVSDSTFWASQTTSGISDPEVRYDRLSGRWFVMAIDLLATNNRLLVAVSSGPTITG